MSAIFGIYHLDGRPVQPQMLENMSSALSHRGNDGTGFWHEGAIGLGHRMLWTTQQSKREIYPQWGCSRQLVITADARIDNRDELLGLIDGNLRGSDSGLTDGEIILRAYEKWGEQCIERFLGDFAFVIWDTRKKTIFCGRDHFGIKPFYYHLSENLFAFATEIKALKSINEIKVELNEEMIADYFIGDLEDKVSTFYTQTFRLPPAHILKVNEKGGKTASYYTLDQTREAPYASNKEYASELFRIFNESVQCRMRGALSIGSKLSGGLDSSSIACIARDVMAREGRSSFRCFSMIYEKAKSCDESDYIRSVLDQGGFEPHFVAGDSETPLTNLDAISRATDRPTVGPGFSASWHLYAAIASSGTRIIFDGHDGDNAISHGHRYLDELAIAGRWLSLGREALGLGPVYSKSPFKIFAAYAGHYAWLPFVRRHPRVRKTVKQLQAWTKSAGSVSWSDATSRVMISLANPDFAKRACLSDRLAALDDRNKRPPLSARDDHYRSVMSGSQTLALEECDAVSGLFGIETRYPFWDKRLIEYCLSLPGDQKCNKGWTRIVMRRAMQNVLPKKVCWRRAKTDFSENFAVGLRARERQRIKEIFTSDLGASNEFFHQDAVMNTYQHFAAIGPRDLNIQARGLLRTVWEIASFHSWMQSVEN